MHNPTKEIIVFLVISTTIILLLTSLIITLIYLYRKKQLDYFKNLEKMKIDYEKNQLKLQLDIQEETFQNISREIHDNIGLSLTLAKLHLNTLNINGSSVSILNSSINLITKAIEDLSDISKSLNSEAISDHGLFNALRNEIEKLEKTEKYKIQYEVTGTTEFIDCQKELVLYRIAQEALNNIIKHSKASCICVKLNYTNNSVELTLMDNGVGINWGFIERERSKKIMAGLSNMQKRAKMLNGACEITSNKFGTKVCVTVPLEKNEK
jgi:signal transduction histidine kinase